MAEGIVLNFKGVFSSRVDGGRGEDLLKGDCLRVFLPTQN